MVSEWGLIRYLRGHKGLLLVIEEMAVEFAIIRISLLLFYYYKQPYFILQLDMYYKFSSLD